MRDKNNAFTVVEIIIIAVIIAIAAMITIPMMSSAASMQIRSGANMVAADLEYAKSLAISRGQNFSVGFDENAETYRIADQYGNVIAHPVKKGFDYIIDFRNDNRLDKVEIASVNFDARSTVTFDSLGSPYSGAGTNDPLDSGTITLQAGTTAITINVEPVTGFIFISD